MLTGKTIILGVTGGIAAYKAANLASLLKKQHADVHVIMTKNALEFITPLTFETLTVNKCLTDTFDRNFKFEVEHIELAKKADLAIIAPATANVCAKIKFNGEAGPWSCGRYADDHALSLPVPAHHCTGNEHTDV